MRGGGPHFLELRTYRFRAHSMYDPDRYRAKEEIEGWKHRDPIAHLADQLTTAGSLGEGELEQIEREVDAEIDDAVAFAEAGTLEPVEDLDRFVVQSVPSGGPSHEDRHLSRGATHGARARRSARDERVFLMGEDVGRYGGCYAVSLGLLEEFGPERVRDTPLSESGFVGAGIGAALGGMRPIVEIMTVNFSLLALDQIVNNAATLLLHVRRPVQRPDRDPHDDRCRSPARRAALAQPRGLVRPHPGHSRAGAGHTRRRPRHAVDGAVRPRPRAVVRARRPLQRRG